MMQRGTCFWIVLLLVFALVAGAGAEEGDLVIIWNRTYGESDTYDAASAVIPGPDGIGFVLAGEAAGDARVTWLAPDGGEEWNRTYGGGAGAAAHSLIRTDAGNFLFAGNLTYVADGAGADTDAWLMEIDPSGAEVWNRTYGGPDVNASASAVIEVEDGGYVFAGSIAPREGSGSAARVVRVNETGDEVWNRTFGEVGNNTANALTGLPGGDIVVVGSTESSGAGMADVWVIRLDESGDEVWNRTFGSPDDDFGQAVINTSDGNILVAGTFTERPDNVTADTDALLIKLTPDGEILWNWIYGDIGVNETVSAVIETADGDCIFAGETAYPGVDDTDAWVVRTDADGAVIWSRTFGGENPGDRALSIIESAPGEYVFAGQFNATGKDGLVNVDAWAMKLGPAPAPMPEPTKPPIKPPKAPIVSHKPPVTAEPTPPMTAKPTAVPTVTPAPTATSTPSPAPTDGNGDSNESDLEGDGSGLLSGRVWYDLNADGIPDPGEPGIPGISVRMIGERTMVDYTVTGPDGIYQFETLPPPGYRGVEFLIPDGYSCTGSDAGLIDRTVAFAEGGAGRESLNVGFIGDHHPAAPAEAYGWVLGTAWSDDNMDGIRDESYGMTDISVSLLDVGGAVVASARTGYHDTYTSFYLFGPLPPGDYSLAFTPPDGYTFTAGGGDSHADPLSGRTAPFTVTGGDTVTQNAGFIITPPGDPPGEEEEGEGAAVTDNSTPDDLTVVVNETVNETGAA